MKKDIDLYIGGKEIIGKYKGFTYKILIVGGHPCAYINIPENHMLFGIPYGDIDINVHGGLTYADYDNDKKYWIGWDYAHYGDFIMFSSAGHKFSLDEVRNDCKKVINQILIIKMIMKKPEYYYATNIVDWR